MRSKCTIPGCSSIVKGHGLCSMHYTRLRNHGDPLYRPQNREDRIDKNGPIPPDHPDLGPCWLWIGGLNGTGYGAHREVYEDHCGAIPAGFELDHLCRNRSCVNPAHMEIVTHQENVRRGLRGSLVTHCPKGHEYTPENTVMHHNRRECLECRRERDRGRRDKAYWAAYRAKRKAADPNWGRKTPVTVREVVP